MRPLLFFFVSLLVASAWADPSVFFEGGLQVEVPASLRALDQAAIDQMFSGAKSKPGVVLATPDSETRVSMTFAEAPLAPADLQATKDSLKARVDAGGATVSWVRDEMVTLNGSPWFRLDYDVTGSGKRETILGTSLKGRLLFVVVATPVDDLEVLGSDLNALTDSLKLAP